LKFAGREDEKMMVDNRRPDVMVAELDDSLYTIAKYNLSQLPAFNT
jgi:hypothetical protein